MSKAFIGGVVCQEFESESTAAEEMLDDVVYSRLSREQFIFQMCIESGYGKHSRYAVSVVVVIVVVIIIRGYYTAVFISTRISRSSVDYQPEAIAEG